MQALLADLRERIGRHGPLRFGEFMDLALYGPHGFYTRGRGAGRRRDFVTSPETGALFAMVLARALDRWWIELGRPDPFVVVEPGAGPGTFAAGVLLAKPECASALRWVLVDRSPAMRELHRSKPKAFQLVEPTHIFGGLDRERDDVLDDAPRVAPAQGPLVASMADIPSGIAIHVIVCNELLDNLAFDVAAFENNRWHDVRVGIEGDRCCEVLVPAHDELRTRCDALVPSRDGTLRIPILRDAPAWLIAAMQTLEHGGRIVAFDYGVLTTSELAERGADWLRLYRDHRRVQSATKYPGLCDITTDVPVDQLGAVARPTTVQSQASFLRAHGIDEIAADAHRVLADAVPGSLAAARLASFATEQEVLCDPHRLGGFLVMEWVR